MASQNASLAMLGSLSARHSRSSGTKPGPFVWVWVGGLVVRWKESRAGNAGIIFETVSWICHCEGGTQ